MKHVVLPLSLALTLAACDGDKNAAPKAADDKKAAQSKPADAKAPAQPGSKPQGHDGSAPKAASPHGTSPHGGAAPINPHGSMKAPGKQPEAGPPRDVKPSGETTAETLAEFLVAVPKEWEKGQPSGMMRMAQWVVPGPGGDAEMVVYRFKGGAGGVDANMARWKGQFTAAEGASIDDVAKQTKKTVGALTVHTLDVTGHYTAAMTPGAADKHDKPDHRMLAAIVEGSGDPLFFKATGPAKTLGVWGDAWTAMIDSIKTGS